MGRGEISGEILYMVAAAVFEPGKNGPAGVVEDDDLQVGVLFVAAVYKPAYIVQEG